MTIPAQPVPASPSIWTNPLTWGSFLASFAPTFTDTGGAAWDGAMDYRDRTDKIFRELDRARDSISPLILDLNRDGKVSTVSLNAGTYFDHANDGFAERTGWVAFGDGLLVNDLNDNGKIDSGLELFGDQTILANGLNSPDGFVALSVFDADQNGQVDLNDKNFNSLKI
jgi:hypothetical protein